MKNRVTKVVDLIQLRDVLKNIAIWWASPLTYSDRRPIYRILHDPFVASACSHRALISY